MPHCSPVSDCVTPTCTQDVDPNTPKGAPVVGSCGYGELVSGACPCLENLLRDLVML